MAKPGDVIEVPQLGVRVQFLATHESTGGAYTEVDVIGRPKGFIRAAHVHVGVTEHHTVLEGAMRIKLRGKTYVLGPGDELTIPPDTPHTQLPAGSGPGRVRIRLTPSARSDEFFERLAQLDYNRFGYPKPVAAARFVTDLGDVRSRRPPEPAHPAAARQDDPRRVRLQSTSGTCRRRPRTSSTRSPTAAPTRTGGSPSTSTSARRRVHAPALQGPPAVPPAHAHPDVALRAPAPLQGETDGDLRGTGIWTLTRTETGTHVRFDWRVTPTAGCCGCSARSCARRCAGTTTGRSPARSRASSPTCASVRKWTPEDAGDEGARAGRR